MLVREGLVMILEDTEEFEVVGQCGDGLHVVQHIIEARPDPPDHRRASRYAAQAASLGKARWNSGRVVGKPRGSMARR